MEEENEDDKEDKIWMSQIELFWGAVVLLGMLVHNNWLGMLLHQFIEIWLLQYNLIAIKKNSLLQIKLISF